MAGNNMVKLKSQAEISKIAAAGHIVADVLAQLADKVKPGISTWELDLEARAIIQKAGATPSFLGYGKPPYPAAICTSIDDEVVHGIPSKHRLLKAGSLISVDVGACLDGFHADAARTFAVGEIDGKISDLIRITEECFWKAFSLAKAGARLGDLSAAVQAHAESHGYGVVRELTGHGIGTDLHEEPDVPNFGRAGHGLRLEPGMVICIEPMINLGTRKVALLEDGWTIVTTDGQPSAHYENTLAVTAGGPVVLTRL
jgi:methionyl aminopeptidase